MGVYNVYKHDVLIEEEITAKKVSEITGIPGNSVCRYAEQGTIKNGIYRVECADVTSQQLSEWDKIYKDCQTIRNARKAKIPVHVMKGCVIHMDKDKFKELGKDLVLKLEKECPYKKNSRVNHEKRLQLISEICFSEDKVFNGEQINDLLDLAYSNYHYFNS